MVNARDFLKTKYLLILSVFSLLMILSMHQVVDFDIGFHLKAGEYIFKNHCVPNYDIFSYAVPNHHYLDSHWLFQLLLFIVYTLLGINGIIVLKTIMLLSVFGVLFKMGYKKSSYIVSVLFMLLCVFNVIERSLERPEVVTFLFLALYVYILHDFKYKNSKWIWLLPILQILWVNIHGLFILGIILMWIYLASELIVWKIKLPFEWNDVRAIKDKNYFLLLLIALLSMAACLISPYGYKGLYYALNLYKEIGAHADLHMKSIDELIPPFSKYGAVIDRIVIPYVTLIVVSAITFVLNYRKLKLANLFIYSVFLYLSLLSNRNIALFAIVTMPIMVINTNEFVSGIPRVARGKLDFLPTIFNLTVVLCIIIFISNIVSNRYYIHQKDLRRFGLGVSDLAYPEKAIKFIKEANIQGNIFNNGNFGGYFIWGCFPERKVFLDGRWEVYGNDFLFEYNLALGGGQAFDSLVKRYDVNYVLLDNQQSLCNLLYKSKKWVLVYFDELSAIFVRNVPQNQALIQKYHIDLESLANTPADGFSKKEAGVAGSLTDASRRAISHYHKASFFINLGLYDLAEREYAQALNSNLYLCEIYDSLGSLWSIRGNDKEAITYFKKAIQADPSYAGAYNNLAQSYLALGKIDQAIEVLQKVISMRNNFSQAHEKLGIAYSKKGLYKEAEKEYKKAIALDQYAFDYYIYLADAYSYQARYKEALEIYLRYPAIYAFINYRIAVAYEHLGNSSKAAEYFKRHIAGNPKDEESLTHVCTFYYTNGLQADAENVYKQLRAAAPNSLNVKKLGEMVFKGAKGK